MLLFFLRIISYDCIFMSLLLKLPTFSRVKRDGASILSFDILATTATVASEMSAVNSLVKIIPCPPPSAMLLAQQGVPGFSLVTSSSLDSYKFCCYFIKFFTLS